MNAPSSNTTPISSVTLYTQAVAKTDYVDTDKLTLKKALALESERRHEEDQSVEKQAKKRSATLRSMRADKIVRTSSQEAAALEFTRALGLSSKETKALFSSIKKPAELTKKAEKALENASVEDMLKMLGGSKPQEILQKIRSAFGSCDPLKTMNISPEAFEVFRAELVKPTNPNTAQSFAKAMGEAEGMIQVLIGQNAATAGILAKFESEFESLKSQVGNNLISNLKAEWAHYQHEEHKMHALGILKKILGCIIAAILAAIGAITGNIGLIAVAAVVVATTFYPPLMDKICEGFARDVLQLKGAAAEAVALIVRTEIAIVLALASGGAAGVSMLSEVGTFSAMFMLTGGAKQIGDLKVDAEHGCDVYSGKATEAEKDEAAHDAQTASYVLGAIALGCMIAGGISSLASSSESAPAELKAPASTEGGGEEGPLVDGGPNAGAVEDTTEDILDEAEDTTEANKKEKSDELKAQKQRRLLNYAQFGLATSTAADGGVDIEVGALLKQMAGTVEALGTLQSDLVLHEESINISTKQMKTEETSTQATTSQAIDELQSMTNNIGAACAHQIVGATSA